MSKPYNSPEVDRYLEERDQRAVSTLKQRVVEELFSRIVMIGLVWIILVTSPLLTSAQIMQSSYFSVEGTNTKPTWLHLSILDTSSKLSRADMNTIGVAIIVTFLIGTVKSRPTFSQSDLTYNIVTYLLNRNFP